MHYFRNLARHFIVKGDKILFTCRDKDVVIDLLNTYGFNYRCIGTPFTGFFGKIFGLFLFNSRLFRIAAAFKPDMFLSAGSIYAAHIAWLTGRDHITLEDTGNMEQIRLYLPFTKAILTPESFHKDLGNKQIRLNCYNELAYLLPARFNPDSRINEILGLNPAEKFVLIRFVSWDATHDINSKGISDKTKRELINILSGRYKVFISSERNLPEDLAEFRIRISAEKMLDIINAAEFYIGEGATMASESAMLGTPAIYVNPLYAGTINDQVKYGLVFHFRTENGLIEKVKELIEIPDLKQYFREKRNIMISDKIDMTRFLIWFVESWPESFRIMKENPEYQEKFK